MVPIREETYSKLKVNYNTNSIAFPLHCFLWKIGNSNLKILFTLVNYNILIFIWIISGSIDNPGISSKQMFPSWIPSKGSVYCRFLRWTSNAVHGPYLTDVISSGNILHASRNHSVTYFYEKGQLNREGGSKGRGLPHPNSNVFSSNLNIDSGENWRACPAVKPQMLPAVREPREQLDTQTLNWIRKTNIWEMALHLSV